MNANNIKQAILSTTAFFDLFDFALSLDELEQYIYGPFEHERRRLASYIKESPKLSHRNALFFLPGREELAETREKRDNHSKVLWEKTSKFVRKLSFIPFIRAVCVCNNLAYNNASEKSDIDLFIIAKRKRLFIVRTLVTLVAHLSGVRRYGKKVSGRICLSFFVSDEGMDIGKVALKPYDIYLAYWLLTIKPIIDKGVMKDFEKANERFLKDYFPRPYTVNRSRQVKISERARAVSSFWETVLGGKIGAVVEKVLMKWQLSRAEKKRRSLKDSSGIVLSESMLKFHNEDRRKSVNERWMESLKQVLA